MKRLLSMFLCVALCLSLCVPAFAAGTDGTGTNDDPDIPAGDGVAPDSGSEAPPLDPSDTYTITYHFPANAEGCYTNPNPSVYAAGETVTLEAPTFVGSGSKYYTFNGWYADPEYTVSVSSISDGEVSDLYASCTLSRIRFILHVNDGSGSINEKYQLENSSFKLTASMVKRSDSSTVIKWEMTGWSETADGPIVLPTGAPIQPGWHNGDVVELYANWKLTSGCTILFNGNGATGGSMPADGQLIAYAYVSGNLIPNAFEKEGYLFNGWNTQANGKGTAYADCEEIHGTNMFSEDLSTITLYAQWKVGKYTVVLHANNDTGATVSQTLTFNQSQALTKPSFVKDGFTLAGWATDPDAAAAEYLNGDTVRNLAEVGTDSVDLYAVWTPKAYTVGFYPNGGTGDMTGETINCTCGETYTLPGCTFARDGYTFVGWARNAYAEAEFFPGDPICNLSTTDGTAVRLYAIWTRNSYRVSFNGNGATTGDMSDCGMEMQYNLYSKLPANRFAREGYTFYRWNTCADGSGKSYTNAAEIVNVTTQDDTDIILYAQWKAVVYSVKFHSNNGADTTKLQRLTYDTDTALSANSFSKTGYAISGWAHDPEAVEAEYANQGTVRNLTSAENGIVDLYAVWTPITYIVAFNANGGTGDMGMSVNASTPNSVTCSYDSPYVLPACTFIRTGFTFAGWSTSPYADAGQLAGEAITNLTSTANAKVTLYAIWTRNTYNVVFDGNGAESGNMSADKMEMGYGIYQKLPANTYEKPGYTFNGWNTQSNGKGSSYKDTASVANLTAVNGSTVTLYAQWKVNGYYVNFHSNNGEDTTKLQRITYDTDTKLSANSFSNTAYVFSGWAASADAEEAEYTNQEVIRNLTAEANGVIDLYAVWTPINYTVTFYANGGNGTASPASVTCCYTETYTLPHCPYTRTGYTFAGWSTSPYGSAEYADDSTFSGLTTTSNGTVRLYAVWTRNTYTVVFDGNGATSGSMENVSLTMSYNLYTTLAPNAFAREGYTFLGWSVSPSSGTVYADKANVVNLTSVDGGTVTLYARWKSNSTTTSIKAATVAFNGNDSTSGDMAGDTLELTVGVPALLPANSFERTGYTFVGWSANANGSGTVYSDETNVIRRSASDTAALTLYAKWQANRYTVVFHANYNGSSLVRQQSFQYGTSALLTANDFTRTGYTFSGWATDPAATVREYADKATVNNLTAEENGVVDLYAVWTPKQYTIAFSANGGTGDLSSYTMSCAYGTSYTLPNNPLIRTGYTFVGWTPNLYGSTVYAEGATVSNLTATANAKVTLYAKWAANSCNVLFNGNGADAGDMTDAARTMTYGIYDILPANVFTRTGYTFNGWNTRADGSGTSYADKASVTSIPVVNGTPVTLYAKWTANRYYVNFHSNDAADMDRLQSCTYGTSATLAANGFSRTGYSFVGWNTKADGSGTTYADKAVINNLTAVDNDVIDLYAIWTKRSYTVVLNANDGTSNVTPDTLTCIYGETYKLPANIFTRTGYNFIGWAKSSYGAVAFEDAASFSNLTTTANAKVTLYAKWAPKSCTVSFDGNGADAGDMSANTRTMTYGVYETLPASAYTRTGYVFAGWNTKADGTGTSYADKATVSTIPTVDGAAVTLYAKWTANRYYVAFHSNDGGDSQYVQTMYYGSDYALTGNCFSRTGYTFVGWAADPTAATPDYLNKAGVRNLTSVATATIDLYAIWTPKQYRVAFNANGGSGSMAEMSSCLYGSSYDLPANAFTRNGYTFAGWATNPYNPAIYEDGAAVSNLTATANGKVTLYATWTKNS